MPKPITAVPVDLAQLLTGAREGDRPSVDQLFDHTYEELRRIARQRLRRHRPGETLNTTALVHEAYLRLAGHATLDGRDRVHFFALASRAMRCILVDYARARTAQKRGGQATDVSLIEGELAAESRATDLLALDEALERLTSSSERLGRVVEYRFFGGLTLEEIAEAMDCSVPTVKRDWTRARAWLHRTMQSGDA